MNYKAICAQIRSTPTGLASCSAFFNEVTTVIATTVQCHSNNCKGLVSVLLKVSGGGRERQVSPTWLPPSQVHTPPTPTLTSLPFANECSSRMCETRQCWEEILEWEGKTANSKEGHLTVTPDMPLIKHIWAWHEFSNPKRDSFMHGRPWIHTSWQNHYSSRWGRKMQVQVRKKNEEQSRSLPLPAHAYFYSPNSWTKRDLFLSSLAVNLLRMRTLIWCWDQRLQVLRKKKKIISSMGWRWHTLS